MAGQATEGSAQRPPAGGFPAAAGTRWQRGPPGEPAPDVVVGVAGGYSLRLPVGWVDADRFETLAQAGRAQLARNEAADAAGTLRGALSMWRGPALCRCP